MTNCQTQIYGAEFSREDIDAAVNDGRLLSMEIEFNQLCNFRCIYCYAAAGGTRNELSTDEFKDVIRQAHDLGARKIIVLGGEPMLYPHLMEMIDYIRSLEMEVELFTNGTRMTADMAAWMHSREVRVVLKMNTFDESLQDILSGRKGAYRQIQDALTNLRQAGYPSATHPLGVSSVICQQNIEELPRLWEWLRDQGILPYFEMITPQGGALRHSMLEPDPHRMEEFFNSIAEIDRTKYGRHWDPRPPLVGGECMRHKFSCAVNSAGDVQSCVGITIPLGNVRTQPLKDILRDSEVVCDLKRHKSMIKGPCGSCDKLEECYGCRGAAYQLTGDYLASDPMCWKNLDRRDEIMFLPVDAARLVPHQPPMLMVDTLLEVGERTSVSEMTVREEMLFVDEQGRLDDAAYVEIIAQAMAAHEGFRKLAKNGAPLEGVLTGVRNIEVLDSARVGDVLRISIRKTGKFGNFGVVSGEVFKGETLVARGEIKVWKRDGEE